jgi:multiple sugar transport system ATP-binding protein
MRAGVRATPDETVTLGIRPEDLSVVTEGATGTALRGDVTLVERLGSEVLVHAHLAGARGETVVAKLAGDASLGSGDTISLHLNTTTCHLFDAAGQALGTS